jgi:hypothetical protein
MTIDKILNGHFLNHKIMINSCIVLDKMKTFGIFEPYIFVLTMPALIILILFSITIEAIATPEFSLWTDNRCSKCHVNQIGGGARTKFGAEFGRDVTALNPLDIGLEDIFGTIDRSNYSRGDTTAIGGDIRFQFIRSSKIPNPPTRLIPMQASIYQMSKITDWLTIDEQVNFAKIIFPGQTLWSASAQFKPVSWLPTLRIGHFMPSLGIRDCDMTSLDRRIAAPDGSESLIPPDWAEFGTELNYEGLDFLTVNAGMFDNENLSQLSMYSGQVPLIPLKHNPSFTGRIMFYPAWVDEDLPNSYIGTSALINGKFIYTASFLGVGITNDIHAYLRFSTTNRPYARATANYVAGVTYMPYHGIFIGGRLEHGATDLIFQVENYTDKVTIKNNFIVLNVKAQILPGIEILPEWRWYDTEDYRSSRFDLQFHLYF